MWLRTIVVPGDRRRHVDQLGQLHVVEPRVERVGRAAPSSATPARNSSCIIRPARVRLAAATCVPSRSGRARAGGGCHGTARRRPPRARRAPRRGGRPSRRSHAPTMPAIRVPPRRRAVRGDRGDVLGLADLAQLLGPSVRYAQLHSTNTVRSTRCPLRVGEQFVEQVDRLEAVAVLVVPQVVVRVDDRQVRLDDVLVDLGQPLGRRQRAVMRRRRPRAGRRSRRRRRPSAPSTSSVCWPCSGSSGCGSSGVSLKRGAGRAWRTRPAVGCSYSQIEPLCRSCGSSISESNVCTGPHGTSSASRRRQQLVGVPLARTPPPAPRRAPRRCQALANNAVIVPHCGCSHHSGRPSARNRPWRSLSEATK